MIHTTDEIEYGRIWAIEMALHRPDGYRYKDLFETLLRENDGDVERATDAIRTGGFGYNVGHWAAMYGDFFCRCSGYAPHDDIRVWIGEFRDEDGTYLTPTFTISWREVVGHVAACTAAR